MDINKVIKNTINEIETPEGGEDIYNLLRADILTSEIVEKIYFRFYNDIKAYIEDYTSKCNDTNRDKGMYKCSLETWQACITNIGLLYFRHNKYLEDYKKIRASGGVAYKDELLEIALEVYEGLCYEFRKQFFIYDCCRFLGLSKDTMYKLNNIHANILKRAHSCQESSMRTALASGRSNVTAMAILLNHDYDYTRTTQVIHTTDKTKSADALPILGDEKPLIIDTRNTEEM